MPTVHLIHGYLGVGKTTFARELVDRERAVLLSLDEFVIAATGSDVHVDDAVLQRVGGPIADLWRQVIRTGVDVVLDFGFWRLADRDRVRDEAAALGAETRLYLVRCADELALERCLQRNRVRDGRTYHIDRAAFEALRTKFEPLDPDEPFELVETDEAGSAQER